MHRVLLLGAGKIGRMIARLLRDAGDYDVRVADADAEAIARLSKQTDVKAGVLDAGDRLALLEAMGDRDSVISALSFRHNPGVAAAALEAGVSYFDLTEDVETTRIVRDVASEAKPGQVFVPQCGLAPGFVSIVANELTRGFDTIDTVHMRVGALPQFPSNAMKYNLTWSTDGLINEYCNLCEAIHDGQRLDVLPLEGLEQFSLDGVAYEAFNTSGGLGTLCDTLDGKVRELNYKTVRYRGHRDLMAFLVNELRLSHRREILRDVLESAIPVTYQDVVVVFCTVTGKRGDELVQVADARKVYPATIDRENWSAIQITTAAGICAVMDLIVSGAVEAKGFVKQEQIPLDAFLINQFGQHYRNRQMTRFANESSEEVSDG